MFHNLFLDPEDTAAFCDRYGYRVCLDVSHSHLAGNHLGKTLTEYVHALGPYIAHLHLVDGADVGEEGLELGDGSVDELKGSTHRHRGAVRFNHLRVTGEDGHARPNR